MTKKKKLGLVAAVAAGAALSAAGMSASDTEPPAKSVQNVAPVEVGDGEIIEPRVYGPTAENDPDQDGIPHAVDRCPWNAGKPPSGCP